MTDYDATRLGEAVERLAAAKAARGVDWMLHSSWCSDSPLVVALVRPAALRDRALGAPRVGALLEVLEWAAKEAER